MRNYYPYSVSTGSDLSLLPQNEGFARFMSEDSYEFPSMTSLYELTRCAEPGFVVGLLIPIRRFNAIYNRLPEMKDLELVLEEIQVSGLYTTIPSLEQLATWYRQKEILKSFFNIWASNLSSRYNGDVYDFLTNRLSRFIDLYWDGELQHLFHYLYDLTNRIWTLDLSVVNFLSNDLDGFQVESFRYEEKARSLGNHNKLSESLFEGISVSEMVSVLSVFSQNFPKLDLLVTLRAIGYLGEVQLRDLRHLILGIPASMNDDQLTKFINNRFRLAKNWISKIINSEQYKRNYVSDRTVNGLINEVLFPRVYFSKDSNFHLVQFGSPHFKLLELVTNCPESIDLASSILDRDELSLFFDAIEIQDDIVVNSVARLREKRGMRNRHQISERMHRILSKLSMINMHDIISETILET